MEDINEVLQTRRLTYFGHVSRMEKDRYPNILMHGYTHGRRPRGRPRKRWLENITEDCEELNLTIHQAPRLANDRVKWRNTAATRADGAWGLVPGLGRAWVGDPCIKLFGYLLFHASHMPKVGQGVPVILH